MADPVQVIWFIAPVAGGAITGIIIAWLMKKRWKARIENVRRQQEEMLELLTSE